MKVLLDQVLFSIDQDKFRAFEAALEAPLVENESIRKLLASKLPWVGSATVICVKGDVEIERPVDGYDNREVDIWDRTTWCRAKPYPMLLKGEGMFMVDGDPRPHIVEVERADGED